MLGGKNNGNNNNNHNYPNISSGALGTMLDVIGQMERAGIGKSNKWSAMRRRIRAGRQPSLTDRAYYTAMTHNYKDAYISKRSMRICHTMLSDNDTGHDCNDAGHKPLLCKACGRRATHYCNMNDEYFCMAHIVGHDDNED